MNAYIIVFFQHLVFVFLFLQVARKLLLLIFVLFIVYICNMNLSL